MQSSPLRAAPIFYAPPPSQSSLGSCFFFSFHFLVFTAFPSSCSSSPSAQEVECCDSFFFSARVKALPRLHRRDHALSFRISCPCSLCAASLTFSLDAIVGCGSVLVCWGCCLTWSAQARPARAEPNAPCNYLRYVNVVGRKCWKVWGWVGHCAKWATCKE